MGELQRVAGGLLSAHAPVFSPDGRHVFLSRGSAVALHSVATKEQVRLLDSHTHVVTAIKINPSNKLQLYTASLDGTVKLWDYTDAVELRSIPMGAPVTGLMFLPSLPNSFLWAARAFSKQEGRKPRSCVYRHDLHDPGAGPAVPPPEAAAAACAKRAGKRPKPLVRNNQSQEWAADPQGQFLCAREGKKLVVYWLKTKKKVKFEHGNWLRCLAVHPTEPTIATGDSRGKIMLWRDLEAKVPVKTTFHWHAHGVAGLAFNSDGSYLVSGGEEAVLVIWQLGSGNRRFLPRLGAPISGVSISPEDTLYGSSHADNTVRVVDAVSLEQRQHVRGLQRAPVGDPSTALKCGMQPGPSPGTVVLNGATGGLQFFNVHTDRLERVHQVVERVFISRTHREHIEETIVDHVAFSKGGQWMATVESRDDGVTALDVRLKFWHLNSSDGVYVLNTAVDAVHKAPVTSLAAHPTEKRVVTASLDRRFKLWSFATVGETSRARDAWQCLYVGAHLDLPCMSTGYSLDGSLLAITAGKFVTLWNAASDRVKTLAAPSAESLRGARFTASHFLIAHSGSHLTVWNLLTCTVHWRLRLEAELICVHPSLPRFGCVTTLQSTDGKRAGARQALVQFDAASPQPITFHPATTSASMCAAAYIESPRGNDVWLCTLDSNLMVNTCDKPAASKDSGAGDSQLASLADSRTTDATKGFANVFGSSNRSTGARAAVQAGAEVGATNGLGGDPASALFGVPAHVLPPMRTLVGQFLDLVLASQKDEGVGAADDAGMAGIEDESNDDDYPDEEEEEEEEEDEYEDDVDLMDETLDEGGAVAAVITVTTPGEPNDRITDLGDEPPFSTHSAQLSFMADFFLQNRK